MGMHGGVGMGGGLSGVQGLGGGAGGGLAGLGAHRPGAFGGVLPQRPMNINTGSMSEFPSLGASSGGRSGSSGAGGASAARTEVVALLMSQLRITGELLKMEAAKIGDEPLDEMVAKLERDMKGVVQRLGALAAPEGAPASGEGVPPP